MRSISMQLLSALFLASGVALEAPTTDQSSRQLIEQAMEDTAEASDAMKALDTMPPDAVIDAIIDAISQLPADSRSIDENRRGFRLVTILNDVTKGESERVDDALVGAWPRATNDSAKFALVFRYLLRRIESSEPIVRGVFEDQTANPNLRDYAASALLHLNPTDYRERLLWELDENADWGRYLLDQFLQSSNDPPDSVVVTIAMRRLELIAGAPEELNRTNILAVGIFHYVDDPELTAAGRTAVKDLANQEERQRAGIKAVIDWWKANKAPFETEYNKRSAKSRPATIPHGEDTAD